MMAKLILQEKRMLDVTRNFTHAKIFSTIILKLLVILHTVFNKHFFIVLLSGDWLII